ncbi:hypothetical protein A256_06593, partial [Pseudomonas syringae pv. actinidiae ICMP 19103]
VSWATLAMKSWEIIAKVYLEFLHTLGPRMARCGDPQISVRAKEPDEVGPETEPGGLPTLAPSK